MSTENLETLTAFSPCRRQRRDHLVGSVRWLALAVLLVMLGGTPVGAQTFAYVTNWCGDPQCESGSVPVIDTGANAVIATIPIVGFNHPDPLPNGATITPYGG